MESEQSKHRVVFYADGYMECQCGQRFKKLQQFAMHTGYYREIFNGDSFARKKNKVKGRN